MCDWPPPSPRPSIGCRASDCMTLCCLASAWCYNDEAQGSTPGAPACLHRSCRSTEEKKKPEGLKIFKNVNNNKKHIWSVWCSYRSPWGYAPGHAGLVGTSQGADGSTRHSLTMKRSERTVTLRVDTLDFTVPFSHHNTAIWTLENITAQ